MRVSKKREWYWHGFHDALVFGVRNPTHMKDSAQVAYEAGFAAGQRAEERILKRVHSQLFNAELLKRDAA